MINFSKFKAMFGAYKPVGLTDWVRFNFLGIRPIPDNYDVVDLGTLDYNKSINPQRFEAITLIEGADIPAANVKLNAYCSIYTITSQNGGGTDNSLFMNTTGYLIIYDSERYSLSAEEFKVSLSGVYLIYKKA